MFRLSPSPDPNLIPRCEIALRTGHVLILKLRSSGMNKTNTVVSHVPFLSHTKHALMVMNVILSNGWSVLMDGRRSVGFQ